MDFSPVISQVFKLWWVIPIVLALAVFRSSWFKGWFGEGFVRFSAKLRLPANVYRPIHNVTLPTLDGTTQIDHIFVSEFGVFVIETKNMKGWIFGGEKQRQWTQTIFKQSYKFQNPLHQNYKHVKALESALGIPLDAIQSVVVFTGDSTFKTEMPANVTRGGGFVRYIKSFSDPILSESQVQEIVSQIESGRLEPGWRTNRQHVQQLRTRADVSAERKCPACGSMMILRTAKHGANAGNQFWGCSGYPRCRTVQNVT